MSYTVRAASSEAEVVRWADVVRQSLPIGTVTAQQLAERQTVEDLRVVDAGGDIAGGALLVPDAQRYGGRSVPMVGINGVAIAPVHRGRGAGRALMTSIIEELAAKRVALSTLYPATQPLYRAVGYEQAGTNVQYILPTDAIEQRDRGADLEPGGWDDLEELRTLHDEHVAWHAGALVRNDWGWGRYLRPMMHEPLVMRVREDGRATGYLIARLSWGHGGLHGGRVIVRDMAAVTQTAWDRLWTAVADHRSMCAQVLINGDPSGTVVCGLREQPANVHELIRWMTRVICVRGALEARGYPTGLSARLELDVADDLLPANHGRFVLEVEDGAGRVEQGGAGSMKLDVRALAPLYTGHADPYALAAAGRLEADDPSLAAAAAIFAGPAPWMSDFF